MKLICWLEELWNDLRFMPPYSISGHHYNAKDTEVFKDHVVMVEHCSRCGDVTVTHCSKEMYKQMKARGQA